MKIEVLGCHGSETQTTRTVGFLIDDEILLEAGTVSSVLSDERQRRIRSVIISHLHLDHIKELPFLLDNRMGESTGAITVYGIPHVLDGLRAHLFNDLIWPDFTRIANGDCPPVRLQAMTPGQETGIGDFVVTPCVVNHRVPSVGLLISKGDAALLYTGDTAPTEEIWELGKKTPHLGAVLIEVSFPDGLEDVARASAHMTSSMMASEVDKLQKRDVPIYIFHMKPRHKQAIVKELDGLLKNPVQVLEEGQVIQL
ncbi:MAG: 3',5'-cyclic-nucleotide phosphodiesterase [bacterium]|nr:3',5'-cyclic-nucleotide phosphodiesterase [bacterium]